VFRAAQYDNKNVGDDFTFNWQLAKQGKKLLFLPSVSIKHLNKTGLLRVLRYQYQLGIGAYAYRLHTSPRIIRLFRALPFLIFLTPIGTMVWIGAVVLSRRGMMEFLKFVLLLPFSFIANNLWAIGFFRALRDHRIQKSEPITSSLFSKPNHSQDKLKMDPMVRTKRAG
jgi:hypothetical protein